MADGNCVTVVEVVWSAVLLAVVEGIADAGRRVSKMVVGMGSRIVVKRGGELDVTAMVDTTSAVVVGPGMIEVTMEPGIVDVTTIVLSEAGPNIVVVYTIVCTSPDKVVATVTGDSVTAGPVTKSVTVVVTGASPDTAPLTCTTE